MEKVVFKAAYKNTTRIAESLQTRKQIPILGQRPSASPETFCNMAADGTLLDESLTKL
jgi:hypothetical protein